MKRELEPGTILVDCYREFRELVRAFATEHYDLMAIVGDGGVGKSQIVAQAMMQRHGGRGWALIKGKHTPLDLYTRLYRHRSLPIVLDDLDGLLANSDNTAMLKAVCETTSIKRVEWGSSHAAFHCKDAPLPRSFDSTSKVCVIVNDVGKLTRDIQALQTRGLCIQFRPTALEVHREVARGGWFDDEEVFRFAGDHLHLVLRPSMRLYIIGRSHKRAGLDWKNLILRGLNSGGDDKLLLVARLLADRQFDEAAARDAARAQAFAEQGGGSRATFYRCKSKLTAQRGRLDAGEASSIHLGPLQRDLRWYAERERVELLQEQRAGMVSENLTAASPGAAEGDNGCPLAMLRRQLEQAIFAEDYERAAQLRDAINRLEAD